uniref:RING-type domain-containing protein n=1 Tax=Pelusios castaneus TaxID=367368 RepID=A0A8C8RHK3_9SAUR
MQGSVSHRIKSDWSLETTCPICLEYFMDPVVLDCDHNFCRACITQCWEGSQTLSCPQCRQTCPEKNLRWEGKLRQKAGT